MKLINHFYLDSKSAYLIFRHYFGSHIDNRHISRLVKKCRRTCQAAEKSGLRIKEWFLYETHMSVYFDHTISYKVYQMGSGDSAGIFRGVLDYEHSRVKITHIGFSAYAVPSGIDVAVEI